jgi:DNA-binding transcriptional LysR family regulator
MSDTLTLYRTFVRVVEAGSFTAVAEERNTSQPTISRQIAMLEDHLGCLLFQRTTRSLALTDDGRIFYSHAMRTIEAVGEAESAVGRRRGKPGGNLRIAAAGVFGRTLLLPVFPRFLTRYPEINIELVLNDGVTDLVEEGVDLAIRVGEVSDQGMIARRIGTSRRTVVATQEYLARNGIPQTPDDLRQHDCIIYSRLNTGSNWTFDTPSGPLTVPVTGRLRVSSTEGVRGAILLGMGIGYVPIWHFSDRELRESSLVALLEDWHPHPQPISAVYPSKRFLSPKTRAMIDYLATEFELDPRLSSYDV